MPFAATASSVTPLLKVTPPPDSSPVTVTTTDDVLRQLTAMLLMSLPALFTLPLALATLQVWPSGWVATATL